MRVLGETLAKRSKGEYEDGWNAMIRDAKKKIEDLYFSIQVFERRKASGEPCPEAAIPPDAA